MKNVNALKFGTSLLAVMALNTQVYATENGPTENGAAEKNLPAEIVVYGRAEHKIGTAVAASEGAVAGADISVRPLLRPAELLEAVPGLIATQHSGGGKANQYFLRGFNLDHGTDFGLSIDDFPVNFRTHGHGQGYLDVGGLIPETTKRVDYRKGPYRAEDGDFTFVGNAKITTHDKMAPFAAVEYGGYGYRRGVAGGSAELGGGDLLIVGQAKAYDGPWALPEKLRSYAALVKYTADTPIGTVRASVNIYRARWNPTEQLPERAVGTLVDDVYGTLDPALTGRTDRQILTAGIDGEGWRASGWVQHYDWSLFSNFTYFLDDPVNGDQLRQFEKLWAYGGRAEKTWRFGETITLKTGAEMRIDDIGEVGLDHSVGGVVDFNRSRYAVTEKSAALYGEAQWKPDDRLLITLGLRGDAYGFRTQATGGSATSGSVNDSILSPKFGASYRVADGIALFANYGQGFHSNDARGVTDTANPAPGLVKGNFKELGFRFERGGLVLTGDIWASRIGSELIYVGDSGAVEPSNGGKRRGYEVTAFWKPNKWLAIDAVWAASKSRFVGLPAGQNLIPGALENSGEIGVSVVFDRWNAAARVRHLGPHALVEDGSAQGEATTLVNFRAAFTPGRVEFYAELLNAFDSRAHDVDYFYTTRLPGEPAAGVEGFNSRVAEPRQLRIGVKMKF